MPTNAVFLVVRSANCPSFVRVSTYFSSAVQFRTVVSRCCGAEDIGTAAMKRRPSA